MVNTPVSCGWKGIEENIRILAIFSICICFSFHVLYTWAYWFCENNTVLYISLLLSKVYFMQPQGRVLKVISSLLFPIPSNNHRSERTMDSTCRPCLVQTLHFSALSFLILLQIRSQDSFSYSLTQLFDGWTSPAKHSWDMKNSTTCFI